MPVAQNIGLDEAKPKQISDSIEVEIIDKSNIVYLPGLKLEVKDFNNDVWPSATVIDVDAQDVLIRFDDMATGPNEWISMDSSRLKMTTQPPDEQKPSRCELFGHEKNSKDTKQKSETVVKEELQETETSSQNADVIQTPEPAKVDVKTETQTLAETPEEVGILPELEELLDRLFASVPAGCVEMRVSGFVGVIDIESILKSCGKNAKTALRKRSFWSKLELVLSYLYFTSRKLCDGPIIDFFKISPAFFGQVLQSTGRVVQNDQRFSGGDQSCLNSLSEYQGTGTYANAHQCKAMRRSRRLQQIDIFTRFVL
ncbi:unnamed protein product [Trichogramma brassicae]|uniref:Tudor domain-containing protein n=1 Tax=Trichogramma brassicae TaxID=86971 RepID=A0A6H5IFN7_9HYME|nr:unnamed protein product [Trichogramma brassicae]